jgi:hypothetical protein
MRPICRFLPVLLLLLSLATLLAPRHAQTVPLYAARQGLMCQTCHFDPNGGGPRNEFGFSFAKNRHSLEADTTGPWKDLTLTNRIGENMPVYLGVNQRFMLLDNQHTDVHELERLGFFNMESAIHIAFQPHDKLTLVYTLDGFASTPSNTVRSKEAYGLIGGLRMDDHTVATRNGFGDFGTGVAPSSPSGGFLPFDPRLPDMGVEIGGSQGNFFGRAAFTNGFSSVLSSSGHAEAKSVKLGYNMSAYQGGISLYDDFLKVGTTPIERFSRWGYYGMTHVGPVALLGEVAAGTDERNANHPLGPDKTNLLAAFAEIDWAIFRSYNMRVRFDRAELDRSPDPLIRDLNTFQRYAIEGEWVPVPFAEIRWVWRYIDAKSGLLPDERQGYLQFHFSY